jgi:serine/threonine-protein kinase
MNAALDPGVSTGLLVSERYRLDTVLGRGGMAVVYRAVDQVSDRVVALKLLEAKGTAEASLFEQEYRTLASLVHPRVIDVFDFGIAEDGSPYYTMELLDGQDLKALSPLPWQALCAYLRDIAASLLLLHARRLVHRDVSPRNVRLDASGRAKLLDFGALASFGIASDMVGTPACTAPEVLRQEPLDQRTDLFSLGVLAYLALTNRRPYAISNFHDAESAWATAPVPLTQFVPNIPSARVARAVADQRGSRGAAGERGRGHR